ncbi:MAG: hypothetical protein WA916_07345 [Arcobacter sp.]|uniref:hypothetical protein n=1 Tax=Arcobacter sp. TaxID=1872629 RepID=UPI003C74CA1F
MHELWTPKHVELVKLIIDESNGDQEKLKSLLSECMLEDRQWNWTGKVFHCFGNEYEWFYFEIDGIIQACCVIYHPKKSSIDEDNIFYVKYLAVAPWNRNTPFYKRQFASLGSILLAKCTEYSESNYKYRCGFSLHALPQALEYYVSKLGMIDYGVDVNEENLHYLEIDNAKSRELVNKYV